MGHEPVKNEPVFCLDRLKCMAVLKKQLLDSFTGDELLSLAANFVIYNDIVLDLTYWHLADREHYINTVAASWHVSGEVSGVSLSVLKPKRYRRTPVDTRSNTIQSWIARNLGSLFRIPIWALMGVCCFLCFIVLCTQKTCSKLSSTKCLKDCFRINTKPEEARRPLNHDACNNGIEFVIYFRDNTTA